MTNPGQLALFPGVAGPQPAHERTDDAAVEPVTEPASAAADEGQLALFADRAVLFRELDAAIARGRFDEASDLRDRIDEAFGREATQGLAPLGHLDGLAWEGPPATVLSAWAEVDRHLGGRPHLRCRVREGVFARLLELHRPEALLAAEPGCLLALFRAVMARPGRSPEDARREARALVRNALLSGRVLEALDFADDAELADLLAEDLEPRWLACLGRINRLWPSSSLDAAEWDALGEAARGIRDGDDPATAFWRCLRLAESPDCPDDLRLQARRRMKQLQPELHALFMRQARYF